MELKRNEQAEQSASTEKRWFGAVWRLPYLIFWSASEQRSKNANRPLPHQPSVRLVAIMKATQLVYFFY